MLVDPTRGDDASANHHITLMPNLRLLPRRNGTRWGSLTSLMPLGRRADGCRYRLEAVADLCFHLHWPVKMGDGDEVHIFGKQCPAIGSLFIPHHQGVVSRPNIHNVYGIWSLQAQAFPLTDGVESDALMLPQEIPAVSTIGPGLRLSEA